MFRRLQRLWIRRRMVPPSAPDHPPSTEMEALLMSIQRLNLLHHRDQLTRIITPPAHVVIEGERWAFPLTPIADALVHSLILSVADDRFYLLRQGGIAGVNEWYAGVYAQTLARADVKLSARG